MIAETLLFGLIVLAIDIPWITYVMAPAYRAFYKKAGLTLKTKPVPAAIAYAIMTAAYYLLIGPGNNLTTMKKAASVGFVTYGIYAFTVLAILQDYPAWLALAETIWGTVLFTIAALLTNRAMQSLKSNGK
jgi:uncharacterized membrane protein